MGGEPPARRYRAAIEALPSAAVLDYRILGPLEVAGEHGPLPLGGPKQRATLAILLLGSDRVVPVERLADDLYAGAAPVTAVTQVQRQVSDLRKVLGAAAIETRAPGYLLHTSGHQVDLHHFERATEQGARALVRGEPEIAAERLREALELWRGPPLADLAYETFAQAPVRRLEELRLAALELRLDADLACGRHAELAGELEELADRHPLRERFRKQLMLTLYRTGRQADALAVYRGTRQRLNDDLGIEPTRSCRRSSARFSRRIPRSRRARRWPSPQRPSGPCSCIRRTTRAWTRCSRSPSRSRGYQ